jgi:hypothetical protein
MKIRLLAALAVLVAIALYGLPALAAGNFTIQTSSVDEKDGNWHVKVRIDLPKAPSLMHIPMRFTFSKEAVDERAIMSKGADPVHHRMVLDTPTKQIVSLDVDFADPSGSVFKSTYFEFDLARKDGYFEAAEYLVSLSGPDGDVGGTQKLMLKGDNPPVYRGAMDFTDNSKSGKPQKGPKIQAVSNGLDGGQVASADDGNSTAAAPVSTDVAAEGNAGSMIPGSAYNKTSQEEAVQDHPKGCGCVAAGLGEGVGAGAAGLAAMAGLGLVVARRRRSK